MSASFNLTGPRATNVLLLSPVFPTPPNMKSIKCKNCGLNNFPTDVECRRCGFSFLNASKPKKEKAPRRYSLGTLLMVTIVGALAYYVFTGTEDSIKKVTAEETNRADSKPAERPLAPGLSRSEYDRQKTQTYSEAVRNSQSLADHNKHIQQTEKVMQDITNGK